MTSPRPLSKYLDPPVSEATLTRQWSAIRERYRPKHHRARWRVAAAGGVAALAVAAAVVIMSMRVETPAPSPWDGTVLVTSAEPLDVALKDGSRLEVGPKTRVQMVDAAPGEVRFSLDHGTTRFSVAKIPGRHFSVVSHDVEVRVTGTRFSVSSVLVGDGHRVAVAVEEGQVRVESRGSSPVTLNRGQSWSTERSATAQHPSARPPTPSPSHAPAATSAAMFDHGPSREPPKTPTAKELLETANAARQKGDAAAAAQSYESLLAQFPGDSRAGLAAFELGRLKMDRLGDLAGAVRALQRAMKLAPSSGFREDALARLVRAYDTMGAAASCRETRSAYLESYPNGVHAAAIEKRCNVGSE